MKKTSLHMIALALILCGAPLFANEEQHPEAITNLKPAALAPVQKPPFHSFTGKIVKNKVRLRTQPNLDAPIVKEFSKGDMLIISGETNDFYVTQPPAGTKAYVFRTFILDNVVEGSKVNIRLEPDLESPVIGQLNIGDKVEGTISSVNNKWLEIPPPNNMRFYVAKEFVEKVGGPDMLSKVEKRKQEVYVKFEDALHQSQQELTKQYDQINLEHILRNFNQLMAEYPDFPEYSMKAREAMKEAQEGYLEKKISYLEAQTRKATESLNARNQQLAQDMHDQQHRFQDRLKEMEDKLEKQKTEVISEAVKQQQQLSQKEASPDEVTAKMAQWSPQEESLYQEWQKGHQGGSLDDFYAEQDKAAIVLKGLIEPYNRLVKNKPGDFVLVNRGNNLPVAFLYSTKVNLQNKIGQEVVIKVVERPNNNFAFPAYFVLSAE